MGLLECVPGDFSSDPVIAKATVPRVCRPHIGSEKQNSCWLFSPVLRNLPRAASHLLLFPPVPLYSGSSKAASRPIPLEHCFSSLHQRWICCGALVLCMRPFPVP